MWNHNFIDMLFDQDTAVIIKQVPIIQAEDDDILCWKLTPTGKFNTKSAYKLCLQVMGEEGEPQPRALADNTKELLKQVWKAKDIAPRIQTFAWRLIRKALPTRKRASKHSKYISTRCARCGLEDDEMHILFTCLFARAAWFAKPWYIRSDLLIQNSDSLASIIMSFASSDHPYATLSNNFYIHVVLMESKE